MDGHRLVAGMGVVQSPKPTESTGLGAVEKLCDSGGDLVAGDRFGLR